MIFIYGYTKLLILKNREDTKQTDTTQKNIYPSDQYFTANELGFDFAFFILQRDSVSFEYLPLDKVKEYLDVSLVQIGNKVDRENKKRI